MPRRRRASFEPPVYTFRVRIRGGWFAPENAREIWREIEIAANQTLADLGSVIPAAFDFTDEHLWAFFLSGKRWDSDTEYQPRWGFDLPDEVPPERRADLIPIRDVPLPGVTGKKEFLFLFDFGDEWEFGVKLLRTSGVIDPAARYPRIVATHGEPPPQYPLWDDEDDEDRDETAAEERASAAAPEAPGGVPGDRDKAP